MRADSRVFAFCNSAHLFGLRPLPALLTKYVSILIPDPGPSGETFLEASVRAIVAALFVNSPLGVCVELVCTLDTHRLLFFFAAGIPSFLQSCM
jgi:hypothetical protein